MIKQYTYQQSIEFSKDFTICYKKPNRVHISLGCSPYYSILCYTFGKSQIVYIYILRNSMVNIYTQDALYSNIHKNNFEILSFENFRLHWALEPLTRYQMELCNININNQMTNMILTRSNEPSSCDHQMYIPQMFHR